MKNGSCSNGVSGAVTSHSTRTVPAQLSTMTGAGGGATSTSGCITLRVS
jgi:hypothetical protein